VFVEESEDRSGGPMLCFKDDGCGMSKGLCVSCYSKRMFDLVV